MRKFSLALLASVAVLAASAAMAETPTAATHATDHADWHKKMCSEMYAHKAGRLAYLEAKLDLTEQQKAAWAKWRQADLDGAAKARSACLEAAPKGDTHPSALDREATMEKFLTLKLQSLQAERPALQAFYEVLSPEQKATFDHSLRHGHHHSGGHHGEHGEHGWSGQSQHEQH